ncbi:SGNH/GDSL hydrolase family protein [Nocardioides sp. zg-ZUI104]|uniref:SGNH/GDSL hydrolase family protein n=1 Tax=Nocardioides faecalis TaxID=2803858 RepID=UPI001BD000B2|nr:SGNH/GDSL hydrolase family protein [Nocardioides faecalis]MBS4754594.1 SGNH/GDSL hydrolase family protein [Nocardioides faecalis]
MRMLPLVAALLSGLLLAPPLPATAATPTRTTTASPPAGDVPSVCTLVPLPPTPALDALRRVVATGRGHVLALGSSTTAGVGAASRSQRWTDRFVAGLAERGLPVAPRTVGPLDARALTPQPRLTLVNAAAPGATAAAPLLNPGGLAPLTLNYGVVHALGLLLARLVGQEPVAVIHMVGANDYANAIAPRRYAAGLEAAVRLFPAATVHLFLGAYQAPAAGSRTAPWSEYGDAMRHVAQADPERRLFLDLAPWFAAAGVTDGDPHGLVAGDRVHPSAAGHDAIARLVLRGLGYGC